MHLAEPMMNGTELSWNAVKVIYLIPDGVNIMTSFRRKLLLIIILQITKTDAKLG